jgi:hypothetical protein
MSIYVYMLKQNNITPQNVIIMPNLYEQKMYNISLPISIPNWYF